MEMCSECKKSKVLHMKEFNLCLDCYEDLFKTPDEEPDFVLENETATIKATNNEKLVYTSGEAFVFTIPKQYTLDSERKYDLEVEKLLKFLFDNMYIHDNAKGFDKVKHMFKEVE